MKNDKIIKGIAAGIVGGLVATAVKTWWESKHPVRSKKTETPPVLLANKVKKILVDAPLKEENKPIIGDAIHWAFGTSTGAIYGALAANTPVLASGFGVPFSLGFYAITHGSTIPMLGLEPYPVNVRMDYAWNEFAGHILFGVTLDLARRATLVIIE